MQHPKDFSGVTLENKSKLPSIAGIYFAVQGEDVLYIGQSYNIRQRWERHHKYGQLSELEGITIHYLESDGRPLLQQESEWLNLYRPPLNVAGPRYYPQAVYEELSEIPPFITYFVYSFTSMISLIAFVYGMIIRDEGIFMTGAIVFLCSTSFYAGSWFTWWVARKIYKAKILNK